MEAAAASTVQLAWARKLHLPDDAFKGDVALRGVANSDLVMLVELWGCRVILAPGRVLDRALDLAASDQLTGETLTELAGPNSRYLGCADLAFTDSSVDLGDSGVATADQGVIGALERSCSAAEVAEVGLSTMTEPFAVVAPSGQVIAGAGYELWPPSLAHVGVLTAPMHRRRGAARLVAGHAINQAVAHGLVVQWRCRRPHPASARLAEELGCVIAGRQESAILV